MALFLFFFGGVKWIDPPQTISPLLLRDGSRSGLLYQAIPLPGQPPRFMKKAAMLSRTNVVGYRVLDEKTGGRLLFLPEVAELEQRQAGTSVPPDSGRSLTVPP